MFVAVIGGNLQGVEATYLSQKAGWEVVVVDNNPEAPASGFCDSFVELDIRLEEDLERVIGDVDLVIPALEDNEALTVIDRWAEAKGVPCAFDARAYSISSSKTKSNRLFSRIGVPIPEVWPDCELPVIVKPNSGSGSAEVEVLHDRAALDRRLRKMEPSEDWIVQRFLDGPLYSLEVIGSPERYTTLQVTDLAVDASYDCKRVTAPTELSEEVVAEFERSTVAIAEAMGLRGLMDLEMVLHNGTLRALEVDARLPSQTPTAVYWSTGTNMVELLGELFAQGAVRSDAGGKPQRGVVYEHIRVDPPLMKVAGEHVMTRAGPLHIYRDFFGADEAITNYAPGRGEWVATLIVSGVDRRDAWAKRCRVVTRIQEHFRLQTCLDTPTEGLEGRSSSDQTTD
jgi:pyrrolysine biosynthesis protein PylC